MDQVFSLVNDSEKLSEMSAAAQRFGQIDAAQRVADIAFGVAEK